MQRFITTHLCLWTLALAPLALAQSPTPVAVFPQAGSQVNTIPSCLIMTAAAQAPARTTAFFPSSMTIFSPSTTFAYECLGTPGTTTPGTFSYFGAVEGGAPFLPFLLAIAVGRVTALGERWR
ncbi:MAG TPA: hypothetical protein PKA37_13070, partial [Planctomycetota bacterium]|nr:hypothetical protein [Planctomycetota bacterium]